MSTLAQQIAKHPERAKDEARRQLALIGTLFIETGRLLTTPTLLTCDDLTDLVIDAKNSTLNAQACINILRAAELEIAEMQRRAQEKFAWLL